MEIDQEKIQAGKNILQEWKRQIPESLSGMEKHKFISDGIINKMPEAQTLALRMMVNSMLTYMRTVDASDIDMGGSTARNLIWLRVHGAKRPVSEFGVYDPDEYNILIQNLLMPGQRQFLFDNRNLDFTYTIPNGAGQTIRYRADVYYDLNTLALNMRAINLTVRPYESFGFHQNVTSTFSLAHTKEGLILITGITGSGKSTTLDAIVDLNNNTVEAHIIIIASPVEFVHQSKKCIIRHREVGRDTRSFKQGTIEALRQDPDIIIIGEMRDPETIMAALEVADSGHKVLSTLHTSSAVESIDRIIGEMPPAEQERVKFRLADVLRSVISQKLVPSIDGKRVMVKEVLLMTPSIKAAIKNNNTSEIYQMISEGNKYGMMSMEQDLKRLYQEHKITLETAFNFANNKRRMQQLLNMV